jgi:hypothetical protein
MLGTKETDLQDFEEEEGDSDYCPSEQEDCSEDDLEYNGKAEVSDKEAATADGHVRVLRRRCCAVRRAAATIDEVCRALTSS